MNYLIVLLLSLPVFAAKIDEGTTMEMKWITIDFEKAPQVTLKGKMKAEKDCNSIALEQKLALISHDRYVLTVDEVTTTMACPYTKKKDIVEMDLQPVTLMNNKRNSIQILVPAGATFSFEQKKIK